MAASFEDYDAVDRIVMQSRMSFVLLRSTRLTDEGVRPVREHGDQGKGIGLLSAISRKIVAVFLVDAEERSTWDGKSPVISKRLSCHGWSGNEREQKMREPVDSCWRHAWIRIWVYAVLPSGANQDSGLLQTLDVIPKSRFSHSDSRISGIDSASPRFRYHVNQLRAKPCPGPSSC